MLTMREFHSRKRAGDRRFSGLEGTRVRQHGGGATGGSRSADVQAPGHPGPGIPRASSSGIEQVADAPHRLQRQRFAGHLLALPAQAVNQHLQPVRVEPFDIVG